MCGPDPGDLSQFLSGHTPFQSKGPDELAELAAGSSLESFATDAVIADYSVHVPGEVWMVCTGHVVLQAAAGGAAIDTIEPGGIFGYTPLLTGGGMEFVARSAEASILIRLPGEQVRTQFAKPAGPAFLASSAWSTSPGDRPTLVQVADGRPVGELVSGAALVITPDVAVRDAVVRMTEQHVSYALISLPDGEYGIFTDRDLRTRVVAAGLSADAPVTRVMSAPAQRVSADLTAETVLFQMLESGLRHMPVTSARGEVIGVLEDADLLAASARQSFMLAGRSGLPRTSPNCRPPRNASPTSRAPRSAAGRRPLRQAESSRSSSTAWCAAPWNSCSSRRRPNPRRRLPDSPG